MSETMALLVKICGIRTPEEARIAREEGADFLGFNFWQRSPRYISPDDAEEILKQFPRDARSIGVFVNEDGDSVTTIAARLGLYAVQLHGDESPGYCGRLRASLNLE